MSRRGQAGGRLRPDQSPRARKVRCLALALARWGSYEDVGLELDMAVDQLEELSAPPSSGRGEGG